MSQIETVKERATANGWTTAESTDGSRTYGFSRGGHYLSVWYGPKGNISGAHWTVNEAGSGMRRWVTARAPRPFAEVLAELAR